ncbi:MAG TPA: serine acetyltransferase [Lactovum miscens]|uniref:serine acetyltransferase n=1 Tax=Lactovum miscens TaxID=190387 RepID=UPI002ED80EEB
MKILNFLANQFGTSSEIQRWWNLRKKYIKATGYYKKILYHRLIKFDVKNAAYMGISYPEVAEIKQLPNFRHGFHGIHISSTASIGSNVTIFQQVTVGDEKNLSPCIGDDVLIGAGAKIIGGVYVGNRVKIGANAVVTKDVPADCTVVGFNRIIHHENFGKFDNEKIKKC